MGSKPIKISQLNAYIGRTLSVDPILGDINLIGEVSNLNYHGTGHVYFTLKDEKSKINCFLAYSNVKHIRYELENGMEIVANGYISVYEKGGYYSFNLVDFKPSGEGNLSIAFGKVKEKLEKEGIFDSKHKKKIPFFPKKIMVMTSPTGAAIRDIHKIIESKNNYVDILTMPVIVQGDKAADDIVKALTQANKNHKDVDVIILGRGGGSIEELWAFNEEKVVRAVFDSEIPIISAVGHETDTTLCDYVADVRGETPTAAANMAVPDIEQIKYTINKNYEIIDSSLKKIIEKSEEKLKYFNLETLCREINMNVSYYERMINNYINEIKKITYDKIEGIEKNINLTNKELCAINPQNIINKGFSIIKDDKGKTIKSIYDIKDNDNIKVIMKDGTCEIKVTLIKN